MDDPTKTANPDHVPENPATNEFFGQSEDAFAILEGATVVYCSSAVLVLFGGLAEDYLGKTPWDISLVSAFNGAPSERASREYIREAYETGSARFDWKHTRTDGIELTMDVALSRMDLPEGPRVIVMLRDVTVTRAAEQQLRTHIEFQDHLLAISGALATATFQEFDDRIFDALQRIGSAYELDRIRLWWDFLQEVNAFCSHEWVRSGQSRIRRSIPRTRVSWSHEQLLAGREYHFSSVDELPADAADDREFCIAEGVKSLVVAPMAVGGDIIGAASFATLSDERSWPTQVVNELSLLSHVLGAAWQRNNHLRTVQENEAELARSQRVASIGSFVESAAPGETLADNNSIIRVSEEFRRIFEIESADNPLRAALDNIHPDDRHQVIGYDSDTDKEDSARLGEYRVIRNDGSVIHVEDRREATRDDNGRIVEIFGTVQDVSGRHDAELQLKRQVRFQSRIAALTRALMTAEVGDLDDRILRALKYIGEAYKIDRISILNVAREQEKVTRVQQWARDDCSSKTITIDFATAPWSCAQILDGNAFRFDTIDDLPDNTQVDRTFYAAMGIRSALNIPVRSGDEIVGSVSFVTLAEEYTWSESVRNELDIFVRIVVNAWTRIQGIRELQEREAELSRSQRVAALGSYTETALPGKTLEDGYGISLLSLEACRIYQIEPGTETVELIASRLHPEDRRNFEHSVKEIGLAESRWKHDYRVVRPDGTMVYVEDRWEIDRAEDNKIIRIFGTVKDVTDRVQENLKLKNALAEIEELKDRLQDENIYLKQEVRSERMRTRLIGENAQLKSVLLAAEKVAPTDVTVLILGETGTGKELIAREIHEQSDRKSTPLISVNCAALSSELIESELFGHDEGAFTGAGKQRKGRFELADGGTLFLDEIGDLPIDVQAKILRVLQSGEFERLGGMKTLHVDVRLITATNRDLREMVRAGSFRADLFYRINGFPILVPPLRNRIDDIPLLANHFVEKHANRLGKDISAISPDMITRMRDLVWPGNVRELEGFMQRALIAADGPVLDYLESVELSGDALETPDLATIQQQHIVNVLEKYRWIIGGDNGAATALGVPPSTLRSRMKKFGIERPF